VEIPVPNCSCAGGKITFFFKFCYDVCNQLKLFIYLDLMINIDVLSLDICDKDQKKHDDAKSISLKKHDGFYTGSGPLKE
jgi:hypothetical protein